MNGRPWDAGELAFLRENYGTMSVQDLADAFERSLGSVYQRAAKEGLVEPSPHTSPEEDAKIRKMIAKGMCNRCIGRVLGRCRCTIRRWRRKHGYPDLPKHMVKSCKPCIDSVRAKTQEQCRKAGVQSLAEIRTLAFRKFAAFNGWPEDLRPREVQILNVLADRGVPMTRLELATAIGTATDRMGANGTLALLASCNGPGGTYTASLMRRGLVSVMKRKATVSGLGKGRSRDLYFLSSAALAILEARTCSKKVLA